MRSNAGIDALRVAVGSKTYSYVEVTDFDGTWVRLTAVPYASRSLDFYNSATLRDSIDSNTWSFSGQFAREIGSASLSPFRSDSAINATDPLVDLHRRWRVWVAAPTPLTFRELARGWVDRIDIAGDTSVITVQGRGEEADLIDRRILFVDTTADPLVPISSDTPKVFAPGAIADVIQDILDDQLGAGVVTLTVDPTAPSDYINGWSQTESIGLFDLIQKIAAIGGAVVRYRYDAADNLTLTLFTPNRTPTTPDWTTNARAYERLNAGIDIKDIRNLWVVKYMDATFGLQVVTSPVITTWPPVSASIARYGLRPAEIDLSAQTGVIDQTSAGNLADAATSDTEFPAIEQDLTEVNAWFGELWDYVRTDANGVHYNEDQFGGVTSVEHVLQNGMLRSSFGLRGKPAGRYRTWLDVGTGAPRTPFTPVVTNLTASWKNTLVGADAMVPGVFIAATVNDYAKSVKVALSAALDFSTIIEEHSVDVTDGTAGTGWVGSGYVTPGTDYYVRAIPYSGALDAPYPTGVPTGVAGDPVFANTRSLPKPTSSATISADTTNPAEIKFDLLSVPVDVLPPEVTDVIAGGSSEIGIPIWFYKSPKATSEHLDLTTIPATAAEILSEYRHREHALGAGRIRLHAHVQAKTGTPTLSVKSSTDDFATTPTDCVALSVTATGRLTSDWATLDTASRDDVQFSAYAGDGADTASLELLSLWAELLPDLVTAFRDFSDDFSDDFS